jgi:hypothetical protein
MEKCQEYFGIYKVCKLVWKRVKKFWIKKGYLWWKQFNFNQYMKNNKIIILKGN